MHSSHDRSVSAPAAAANAFAPLSAWRTPALIIGFGCLISLMSFGPRSALGFFLPPMQVAHLQENLAAAACELPNDAIKELDTVASVAAA
jgi:hypothetical protein